MGSIFETSSKIVAKRNCLLTQALPSFHPFPNVASLLLGSGFR